MVRVLDKPCLSLTARKLVLSLPALLTVDLLRDSLQVNQKWIGAVEILHCFCDTRIFMLFLVETVHTSAF